MSEASLIPGAGAEGAPPLASPSRAVRITCGYCDCQLAADGGVLRTSDRVKALNKQEERIDALKADLARLEGELVTARGELTTLKASLQPASAGDDRW